MDRNLASGSGLCEQQRENASLPVRKLTAWRESRADADLSACFFIQSSVQRSAATAAASLPKLQCRDV